MKNPPHPGVSVRHDCLEPLRLTVTKAAEVLGVTRQALNNNVLRLLCPRAEPEFRARSARYICRKTVYAANEAAQIHPYYSAQMLCWLHGRAG